VTKPLVQVPWVSRYFVHVGRSAKKKWRKGAALWQLHWPYLLLFVVANVIVGSLGVCLAALLELADAGEPRSRILEQLNAGGFYTFSIAFLASSVSLVVAEYLEDRRPTHKQWKVVVCVLAVLLGMGCAFFASRTSPPSTAIAVAMPCQRVADSTSSSLAAQVAAVPCEDHQWSRRHLVQLAMFAGSVVCGLLIFLLMQYSSKETKIAMKRIDDDYDDDADDIASSASPLIGH
jgi:MFS family permease